MATSNARIIQEATEVLELGDTVKVLDSPIDKIKKSARGRVTSIQGDYTTGETVMVTVVFRVKKQDFPVYADSKRFTFVSHNEVDELPDAENIVIEEDTTEAPPAE